MRPSEKRWLPPPEVPVEVAQALAAALKPPPGQNGKIAIPEAVCKLLAARGVTSVDEARRFLRPSLEQVENPSAMADMDRAAERIALAVRNGETILVHGDYDVDGICSTALMTRVLRAYGGNVVPFIPDRLKDGYDLGPAGVAEALRVDARVVLTCDCGTTAIEPAASLKREGIDLIISDHHLPGPELPDAFAIINPQRSDCPSADKNLAAVGVAYKLALAVTALLGGDENLVHDQLDLVALATVADVARLRGENRVFVRLGLARIVAGGNRGLKALVRAARLDGKPLNAGRLGFTLAPRLNALGRLSRAVRGVDLLLADDDATANSIARECEELNIERQEMDKSILAEAMRRIGELDLESTYGIVLHSEDWHPGVIGIVASRIVERTGRPTFMIAVKDGVGKGSGRSISAFDLHSALGECGDLLIRHGGHRAAAGLTVDVSRIEEFAQRFDAIARERLTPDDLIPELRTDLELSLDEADEDFERALRHMEPFGVGNPGPILVARRVRVCNSPRRVGTDALKFAIRTARGEIEALGWGLASRSSEIAAGVELDIAYRLEVNEYRGERTLQATLQDFRVSSS